MYLLQMTDTEFDRIRRSSRYRKSHLRSLDFLVMDPDHFPHADAVSACTALTVRSTYIYFIAGNSAQRPHQYAQSLCLYPVII